MSTETPDMPREEILSPEETDALLHGIEDGSVPTGGDSGAGEGFQLYDFAGHERISRRGLPTLQAIDARFTRRLRRELSEMLGQPVEVHAGARRPLRCGDHQASLPTPCSLNLVRFRPLAGTTLVVFPPQLIDMAVDTFFGGSGSVSQDAEKRELTTIELRMSSLLLEHVFVAWVGAWETLMELKPSVIAQEQNPRFAVIARPAESVLVSEYEIALAEGASASMQVVLPSASLAPLRELLDARPPEEEADDQNGFRRALRARLEDAPLPLDAALTKTRLRLGEVLQLKAGDVIPVELPETLSLRCGAVDLFEGKLGASRGRNALEITAAVHTDRTDHKEDEQ